MVRIQTHRKVKERMMEEAQQKRMDRMTEQAHQKGRKRMMEEALQKRLDKMMELQHQKVKERIMEEALRKRIDRMVELQYQKRRDKVIRCHMFVETRLVESRRKHKERLLGKNLPSEPMASPSVIVLGGRSQDGQSLTSVEGYISREGRWIRLPEMEVPRAFHSAVVVDHVIIVSGGDIGDSITDTIEILDLDETPLQWRIIKARLPVPLSGHQTVVYQGNLIIIGGHNGVQGMASNMIYMVPLTAPHTPQDLFALPQPRAWHGAELVGDKIYIFGGGRNPGAPHGDVLVYDILENSCEPVGELAYQVQGMATVRRGNGVFLIGGVDNNDQELDDVMEYHIPFGETTPLPRMIAQRGGCSAVIGITSGVRTSCSSDTTAATIVVSGSLRNLKTVECYDFAVRVWNHMPPTIEAREFATMVVSPINLENISIP